MQTGFFNRIHTFAVQVKLRNPHKLANNSQTLARLEV